MTRSLITDEEHASLHAWRSGDRVYVDVRNIELTPDQARAFGCQVSALADLAGAGAPAEPLIGRAHGADEYPMTRAEQLADALDGR